MATGITKREQLSSDALTALSPELDPIPLPEDGAVVELSYSGKAAQEDILRPAPVLFDEMRGRLSTTVDKIPVNSFILADNFFALHKLVSQSQKVSLFYLDPPYRTGMDFQSRDLEHAYRDSMGVATYLEFLRRRIILMRECMTDDGSIYVHIGHQMISHVKILLDEIFGPDNFRNLIARRKCSSKNFTTKQYANLNDYILFYSKGRNYKWNAPGISPSDEWIEREYPKVDRFGRRFKLVPVHAPGTRNGETGTMWRGKMPPPGKHWQYPPSTLDELDRQGDIHWSKNGNPRRKVYWRDNKKVGLTDYWDCYRDAHHQSIKITGYPTEKNFQMMKMIVEASSAPGDLVVDPFCGSGTTLQAARDSGRQWVGIDASFTAAKASLRRMRHGAEAMGDYVNKRQSQSQREMFAASARMAEETKFLIASSLLGTCRAEIEAISMI